MSPLGIPDRDRRGRRRRIMIGKGPMKITHRFYNSIFNFIRYNMYLYPKTITRSTSTAIDTLRLMGHPEDGNNKGCGA